MDGLKILILGEDRYILYEEALENGFKQWGCECKRVGWYRYFMEYAILKKKIANKLILGNIIKYYNNYVIEAVNEYKPDIVFLHRTTHVYPHTVREISKYSIIFSYHNDDPFSSVKVRIYNRYFIKSLSYCDWIFAYRQKNIDDYKKRGFSNVSLLRSYYIKERNYYIEDAKKSHDVIFIGHYENDGRDEHIYYLLKNGINVKIFGTLWQHSKYYEKLIKSMNINSIEPLYDNKYNEAINNSKIALVFLSKLNNDTYTRRCFEIPATKTAMCSEYTEDLSTLYNDSKEIIFFRNKEELYNKVKESLSSGSYTDIGLHGYKRLMHDGHEVADRCKEILDIYHRLNQ